MRISAPSPTTVTLAYTIAYMCVCTDPVPRGLLTLCPGASSGP